MIIKRKLFSNKKESSATDDLKRGASIVGGAIAAKKGLDVVDDVHRSREISGRVRLYHGTTAKNEKKILEEGLKGKKALESSAITNQKLGEVGKIFGKEIVYTGKKRAPAIDMMRSHAMNAEKPSMIRMSIPHEEYQKMKSRRVYENPEFTLVHRSKTKEEFAEQMKNNIFHPMNKKQADKYYDKFSGAKGTSGTRIFEGDIESKYIKGGKGYKKNSLKEVGKYIKKNPKRFAKGLGKAALGTSLLVGGITLAAKSGKKKKKEK